MNQKYVFISYSSKEYSEATKVCIHLEANGINCWMAPRNIQPGESYASQIVKAIDNCSALVLLASKETNESGHVSNEVSIAFDKKKTIIPFRIEDFTFTDEFIYFLGRKHWINAFEDFEKGLSLLTDTLKSVLDVTPDAPKTENEETIIPEIVPTVFEEPKFEQDQTKEKEEDKHQDTNSNNKKYKYCTNCGSRMDAALPICTNCGQPFNQNSEKKYKYCTNCGSKMDAVLPFCTNCGLSFSDSDTNYYTNGTNSDVKFNGIEIATVVFMVLCTIGSAISLFFIPLIWCIPMTISYVNKVKNKKQISTAFKICTLLFVGLIPGILMFCNENN